MAVVWQLPVVGDSVWQWFDSNATVCVQLQVMTVMAVACDGRIVAVAGGDSIC